MSYTKVYENGRYNIRTSNGKMIKGAWNAEFTRALRNQYDERSRTRAIKYGEW